MSYAGSGLSVQNQPVARHVEYLVDKGVDKTRQELLVNFSQEVYRSTTRSTIRSIGLDKKYLPTWTSTLSTSLLASHKPKPDK